MLNQRTAIFIGIGNIGVQILRAVKKKASNVQGRFRFLGVDCGLLSNHDFTPLETEDFFNLDFSNVQETMRNLETAEQGTFSWLNPALISMPPEETDDIRQIARFSLIWNSSDFHAKLESLVRGTENAPVSVFIVAELGDTVGGGCFLDVCYLTREILGEHKNASLFGCFFLPDAFSSPVEEARARNSYAAMRELEYCMNFARNSGGFRQVYRGLTADWKQAPVDYCFLVAARSALEPVSALLSSLPASMGSGQEADGTRLLKTLLAENQYCAIGFEECVLMERVRGYLSVRWRNRLRESMKKRRNNLEKNTPNALEFLCAALDERACGDSYTYTKEDLWNALLNDLQKGVEDTETDFSPKKDNPFFGAILGKSKPRKDNEAMSTKETSPEEIRGRYEENARRMKDGFLSRIQSAEKSMAFGRGLFEVIALMDCGNSGESTQTLPKLFNVLNPPEAEANAKNAQANDILKRTLKETQEQIDKECRRFRPLHEAMTHILEPPESGDSAQEKDAFPGFEGLADFLHEELDKVDMDSALNHLFRRLWERWEDGTLPRNREETEDFLTDFEAQYSLARELTVDRLFRRYFSRQAEKPLPLYQTIFERFLKPCVKHTEILFPFSDGIGDEAQLQCVAVPGNGIVLETASAASFAESVPLHKINGTEADKICFFKFRVVSLRDYKFCKEYEERFSGERRPGLYLYEGGESAEPCRAWTRLPYIAFDSSPQNGSDAFRQTREDLTALYNKAKKRGVLNANGTVFRPDTESFSPEDHDVFTRRWLQVICEKYPEIAEKTCPITMKAVESRLYFGTDATNLLDALQRSPVVQDAISNSLEECRAVYERVRQEIQSNLEQAQEVGRMEAGESK